MFERVDFSMSSFDIVAKGDFRFYVIEDLRAGRAPVVQVTTESLNEALSWFDEFSRHEGALPALGARKGEYCLDLLQRVNGNNVLVRDYKNDNVSVSIKVLRPTLDKIVGYLIDEGAATHAYYYDLFSRVGRSCPVVGPVGRSEDGFDNGYCEDKRLKTSAGYGRDAINQVLVVGHGWVEYRDLLEEPGKYWENGVLQVEGINVNYVLNKHLVGIDGQMDVSVHDFSMMVKDIRKEFSLVVFDNRLDDWYVGATFDEMKDAVKAFYALPADAVGHVKQTLEGDYQQVVFNGVDESFDEIPFEKAARMFGFDNGDIGRLIANAEHKVGKMSPSREQGWMERG